MHCNLCGEKITGTWTSETRTAKTGEEIVEYFHSDWGPYAEKMLTCAMQVARMAGVDARALFALEFLPGLTAVRSTPDG